MKYAIKIPFGNPEDKSNWIFVTESKREDFDDVHVKIYDSLESAEKAAKTWRIHEVVEYQE
jgi:hypothetical protein